MGCSSRYCPTLPWVGQDLIPRRLSVGSPPSSRNWGTCLEDEPPQVEYSFPELPPGAMYDANHQCRLSYGQEATHCADIEGIERVCQTLWCRMNNRCITRMDPAAEGTQCGKHKVSLVAAQPSAEPSHIQNGEPSHPIKRTFSIRCSVY